MTEAERTKRTYMQCTEGGSNKDYDIWIEPKDGGYVVPFLFGPIGGTKQSGCKTPKPVPLAEAEKAHAKTVKEKLGKGYVMVEAGDAGGGASGGGDAGARATKLPAAYTQVEGKVDSGIRPMLLTEADEEEDLARFIADPEWAGQPKVNGLRLMVRVKDGKVTAANRKGLERPIPVPTAKALSMLGDCIIDGELVGETYHAFDLLEEGATNLCGAPMLARQGLLRVRLKGADQKSVRPVETVGTEESKNRLVNDLRVARKEGVVFKRLDGVYEPGRRENLKNALAVKVKFLKELSAVVKRWTGGKSSVELAVFDDGGREVFIGKCTVPAKHAGQVKPGVVVGVRYLYATDDDKLFQPRLDPTDDGVVVREDLNPEDCRFSQLVREGKGKEEDDR